MKADQQADFVQRLRCAAGHLNAVIEMSEAGRGDSR
jgi:DNA-binding FrmR family transcriptional regulator